MVVVPASWLNIWGPDRISQQLSIRETVWRHQKNVLKWSLHWVRSFPCKDGRFFFVSLVSPGLSKILVESAGRSIQRWEIGAALSVRTCEQLVTQLPSEKVVQWHMLHLFKNHFDVSVLEYIPHGGPRVWFGLFELFHLVPLEPSPIAQFLCSTAKNANIKNDEINGSIVELQRCFTSRVQKPTPLKRTVLLQNRLKLVSLKSKSWCVGHVDFPSNLHLMSVIITCFLYGRPRNAFPVVDSVTES